MITYNEWKAIQQPDIQKLLAEGMIPRRVMSALQMLKSFPESDIKLLVAMLGVAGTITGGAAGLAALNSGGDTPPAKVMPAGDMKPPMDPNISMSPPH